MALSLRSSSNGSVLHAPCGYHVRGDGLGSPRRARHVAIDAPAEASTLLNYPHHAKIKPESKLGVSLNRRGRPGCAWDDYRGSGMCTGTMRDALQHPPLSLRNQAPACQL